MTAKTKKKKVRLALRHKKLTRVHEAVVRDARLHDVALDTIAIEALGLGPNESAALLAMEEDSDAA